MAASDELLLGYFFRNGSVIVFDHYAARSCSKFAHCGHSAALPEL